MISCVLAFESVEVEINECLYRRFNLVKGKKKMRIHI
jgi:hypothetical protein